MARRSVASRFVSGARRHGSSYPDRPGITVATVTWNSLPYLKSCIAGIRKFTNVPIEILVVDNHSADGTGEYLTEQPDLRSVRTPFNIGHGLGLDLAMAHARTEFVVMFDVDAFPISSQWLDEVTGPLEAGAIVAGAYVQRAFIHPSFLAIRRQDYLRLNLRFVPIGSPATLGSVPRGLFMDVGEALSHTVAVVAGSAALHRVPITEAAGDNLIGSIYGGVVYHNFYSTQGKPELVTAAQEMWKHAVDRYLTD